uniref:RNA binding motif protein 33 n=1 Tax=Nothobranchius kadleci TaxID=1051664 RepID=A0A1A8BLZ4_NOTKA
MASGKKSSLLSSLAVYGDDSEPDSDPEPEDLVLRGAGSLIHYYGDDDLIQTKIADDKSSEDEDSRDSHSEMDKSDEGRDEDDVEISEAEKRDPKELVAMFSERVRNMLPNEIRIPPEPPGRCSSQLQEKIHKLYERKLHGDFDTNSHIQQKKEFRNPSIYEKLIQYCGIDELGTNYPKDMFDPHSWSEDSYYEALAKAQKVEMDKLEKAKKERTKIEFVTGTKKGANPSSTAASTSSSSSSCLGRATWASARQRHPSTSPTRLPHHDTMSPLPLHQQQQHHRQDLPRQQQINLGESRPMTHHGQNLFHQQHGSPRQMTPRPQNPQQRNMSNRQRMNTPISKQMQQRNSNLRELPVAPANTNMNNTRPTPTPASQAANIRPVARATLGTRPGQNAQPTSGGGRGRGQAPNTFSQHGGAGRTVVTMETLSSPSQSEPQDPDEDEETRQYRLKIEEQKRLREEILRKKELRRQMQAGVRKKELLERLNSQTNSPNQGPAPTQTQPLQFNQHRPHPIQPQQQLQQPLLPQPPPLSEQTRPQLQAQHQRPAPQRMPQMLNYTLRHLNQDNALPPSGTAQTPAPRSNVKSRLQMVKGFTQEQQSPGVAPEQQWKDPQQQQQRNNSVQIVNRLNAPAEAVQVAQNASRTQGPGQTQGPRPAAKRTVMQRVSISGVESQQVPQKVRVVKLSGMSGAGPEATSGPVQQQSSWQASPLNQSVQRKVTMMGQQQQGPGGAPQASRGGRGNAQQSRVVVTGRGQGRGGGQMGRGHPVSVQQNLRGAETPRCTVSIEGLSTSTSEIQLKNLLKSIGPIEMFKMMPQQRKAVATFSNPQHAADFQSSFNRHMIDLSHIEITDDRSRRYLDPRCCFIILIFNIPGFPAAPQAWSKAFDFFKSPLCQISCSFITSCFSPHLPVRLTVSHLSLNAAAAERLAAGRPFWISGMKVSTSVATSGFTEQI